MRKINGLESILALTIAAGSAVYSGCGDDVTPDDGDAQTDADADTSDDAYTNHAPDPIDVSSITPPEGSAYHVGDIVPFGFDVPNDSDGDSLTGTVHVTGDSDTTPGPSAGDYSADIPISGPLTSGAHVSQDINTATEGPSGAALPTRADGSATPYTLEIILEDGQGGEARAERNVTVTGGSANPVRVTGCYVRSANIGRTLGIDCYATDSLDPSGASLIGNWQLTTDISRATITDTAPGNASVLASTLGASDVGLHNYSVTASNGTTTSDSLVFEVPVDEHGSRLRLHCNDGSEHALLLPETSVDAVSEACFTGFNPSLKPSHSADPQYIGDVEPTCARSAIATLSEAEREAHRFYNGSASGDKTPESVFTSCTVDFGQVEYFSNN